MAAQVIKYVGPPGLLAFCFPGGTSCHWMSLLVPWRGLPCKGHSGEPCCGRLQWSKRQLDLEPLPLQMLHGGLYPCPRGGTPVANLREHWTEGNARVRVYGTPVPLAALPGLLPLYEAATVLPRCPGEKDLPLKLPFPSPNILSDSPVFKKSKPQHLMLSRLIVKASPCVQNVYIQ